MGDIGAVMDGAHPAPIMLTGNQIAAARRLAGIASQADLAQAAGVSRPTIERAEGARNAIPPMRLEQMVRVVQALERSGIEFILPPGSTLAGGIGMRLRGRSAQPSA